MSALFGTTILISSLLLFWIQPLVSKMITPLFGGTPMVWTACMLFFQVFLLAGYLYAHIISVKLSLGKQIVLHCLLLLAGLVFLPFGFGEDMVTGFSWNSNPVFLLIGLLAVVVGFPFLIVSASSPLIQKWLSRTRSESSDDPYFLYAISNAGSLIAILAYPFLIEPLLPLTGQSRIWALAYGLMVGLFFLVGVLTWSRRRGAAPAPVPGKDVVDRTGRPTVKRVFTWILLAFVPSSLMLGITTHITTDIASVPLLWVVPLAIYLLSYILVFARRRVIPGALVEKLFPVFTLVTAFMLLTDIEKPVWLVFLFFLFFLFTAALALHGRLARDRPPARYLTAYYLFLALGGALGGVFNALVAPMVFTRTIELPLALIVAAMAYKKVGYPAAGKKGFSADIGTFFLVGALTTALAVLVPRITLEPYQLWMVVIFGIPLVVSHLFSRRPLRFGLALGAVFAGSLFYPDIYGDVIYANRNFFGSVQVRYDRSGPYHRLFYGTTQHGLQFTDPQRRGDALAYYHRSGPFGDIYRAYRWNPDSGAIGVIGLGIGAMLTYSRPGQHWTFYEIDPGVVRIARDTRLFTHWADARASGLKVISGDARIALKRARPGSYGLMVVDAFNSDAIPVHLITCEAFQLYLSKLSDRGLLAINVTNKNLDLTRVINDAARKLNLFCVFRFDPAPEGDEPRKKGKFASLWALLVRDPRHLGPLLRNNQWRVLSPSGPPRPWTDDYSNILGVLKWF